MNTTFRNRFLPAAARCIAMIVLLPSFAFATDGQDKAPWQTKKCAVVLTYDDALNVHLDNVVPLLVSRLRDTLTKSFDLGED